MVADVQGAVSWLFLDVFLPCCSCHLSVDAHLIPDHVAACCNTCAIESANMCVGIN